MKLINTSPLNKRFSRTIDVSLTKAYWYNSLLHSCECKSPRQKTRKQYFPNDCIQTRKS